MAIAMSVFARVLALLLTLLASTMVLSTVLTHSFELVEHRDDIVAPFIGRVIDEIVHFLPSHTFIERCVLIKYFINLL